LRGGTVAFRPLPPNGRRLIRLLHPMANSTQPGLFVLLEFLNSEFFPQLFRLIIPRGMVISYER
jgi:hypothetical protein